MTFRTTQFFDEYNFHFDENYTSANEIKFPKSRNQVHGRWQKKKENWTVCRLIERNYLHTRKYDKSSRAWLRQMWFDLSKETSRCIVEFMHLVHDRVKFKQFRCRDKDLSIVKPTIEITFIWVGREKYILRIEMNEKCSTTGERNNSVFHGTGIQTHIQATRSVKFYSLSLKKKSLTNPTYLRHVWYTCQNYRSNPSRSVLFFIKHPASLHARQIQRQV